MEDREFEFKEPPLSDFEFRQFERQVAAIGFDTMEEAMAVRDALHKEIEEHGMASVGYFYTAAGYKCDASYFAYGWGNAEEMFLASIEFSVEDKQYHLLVPPTQLLNSIVDAAEGRIPEKKPERVDHPDHYQTRKGLEAIDVMEAFTEDLVGEEAVLTATALKYLLRWKKKNGLEDLKKARWYLNRLIEKQTKQRSDAI